MERGYVKLWRSIDQNELLENDNTAFLVFAKLLIRVDRHTGSYRTGRFKLAHICNLNPSTLRDALKRLEAATIIRQQSDSRATTIFICNWTRYQQEDDSRTSGRRRTDDTKQEKKEKENKKEIYKEKKLSVADPFIELNQYWSDLSGRKMSDNKTARAELKKILQNYTIEEIRYAIKGAVYFQGKSYKPQVLSFSSLYKKWDDLSGHMQAVLNKGSGDESNRFE